MGKINKKILHVGILLVISVVFYGCPEPVAEYDLTMTIKNESSDKILFYSYITNPKDTTLMNSFPWYNIESSVIKPNESREENFSSSTMINAFEKGYSEQYYFFIYDSIKKIPWQGIRDEYIVAKRVDFDAWDEMEAVDFTITYP